MPTHETTIDINGQEIACRIYYHYTPYQKGQPTEDDSWPDVDEEWIFTTLQIWADNRWQYAPALLDVIDQDALIEEIKEGFDDAL